MFFTRLFLLLRCLMDPSAELLTEKMPVAQLRISVEIRGAGVRPIEESIEPKTESKHDLYSVELHFTMIFGTIAHDAIALFVIMQYHFSKFCNPQCAPIVDLKFPGRGHDFGKM